MTGNSTIILKRTHCTGDNIPSNSAKKKEQTYLRIPSNVKLCPNSHAFISVGMFTYSKPAKIAGKTFSKLKIYMATVMAVLMSDKKEISILHTVSS